MNNKWLSTKYQTLKKATAVPNSLSFLSLSPDISSWGKRESLLTFMVLTHRVIVGGFQQSLVQFEALLGDFLWQYINKTELQP